jgi:undecaprenyl-diphosphatase
MTPTYGAGAAGFGVLSIIFVITLLGFLTAGALIAHFPKIFIKVGNWAFLGKAGKYVNRRVELLARRLSMDVAVAASLLAGVVVVAVLAVGFAELLDNVLENDLVALIDHPIEQWAAGHRDQWLTAVMKIVTLFGKAVSQTLIAGLVAGYLAWRNRSWLPVVLATAALGGVGIALITTKAVVGRSRPPSMFALTHEDGFSFPSGHATGTAATAVLCAWLVTHWLVRGWTARVAVWTFASVYVGLVCFSRVYLGVHYFSDVVAGAMLGAAWAGGVIVIGAWWDHRRQVLRAAETQSALPAPTPGGRVQREAETGGGQNRDEVHRPRDSGAGDEDAPKRE